MVKVKFCAFETFTDRSCPEIFDPSNIVPFIFELMEDSNFFTSSSTCKGNSDKAGAILEGKYDSFGFSICNVVLHDGNIKVVKIIDKIKISFFTFVILE
jgi:hypothetical protein